MNKQRKKTTAGFTLIELMIVVAIIGIIAAVAYPSYQDNVRKGKRSDGQAALLNIMALQERYYSDNNVYTDDLTDLGLSDPELSSKTHYSVGAGFVGGSNQRILLTATPQFTDTSCANLTFDSTGPKAASGTGSNCW